MANRTSLMQNDDPITILAIESSCDDTAAAVIKDGKILANIVADQKVHEKYGGVVPELASRAHQQNIVPVVQSALEQADISKSDLSSIAFTVGPGLMGSLLVGASFAKSLALGLKIPLIAVNHMQGHILAHFIKEEIEQKVPSFPFLCLTVSGGHTQLVLVKDHLEMEVVGSTLDDAAGEAFDKAGKIMGLPYPAGPLIDKLAKDGEANTFKFTLPRVADNAFSFSGIKSSFLYFLQDQVKTDPDFVKKNMNDLCASIQYTIVKHLLDKFRKAIEKYDVLDIAICGGVSANTHLRTSVAELGAELDKNVFVPKFEYCTDNAAMIAITAHFKYKAQEFSDQSVRPQARLSI